MEETSGTMNNYDIKKIMKGISINKNQSPGIRIDVVMQEIPEELQKEIEIEIKKFEEKAKDIVTAATETMSEANQVV